MIKKCEMAIMVLVVVHFCWYFFVPDSKQCSNLAAVKLIQTALDLVWLIFFMFCREDERMRVYTLVTFCVMICNFGLISLGNEWSCLQLDLHDDGYIWVTLFMSPVQLFILCLYFKSETTTQHQPDQSLIA